MGVLKTYEGAAWTANSPALSDHQIDPDDAHNASATSYDNATSGLTATNVQAAVDETVAAIAAAPTAAATRAYRATSAVTIANNTVTAIALNAENFDTEGLHDNTTDPTRFKFTAATAGTWLFIGSVGFVPDATGVRNAILRLNGSQVATTGAAPSPGASASSIIEVSSLIVVANGDYVELACFQASGGNLNVGAGTERTYLNAIKII